MSADEIENRVVVFDLPFPLLMADLNEGGEIWVAGDPPAAIGLHRQLNERGGFRSPGVLLGGDPYGRVTYTKVQVRFHAPTSPEVVDWTDTKLIDQAVKRVNRLVEHYRDVFNQGLARPVSSRHLVHTTVIEDGPSGKTSRSVGRSAGPLQMGQTDEHRVAEQEVRARLQRNDRPSLLRMLMLEVDARLSIGESRLAVTEAATYSEAWLTLALKDLLRRRGESDPEIEKRFVYANGQPRSTYNIVTKVLPQVTGYTGFPVTREFREWDKARGVRNDLVHGSELDVSEDDAVSAARAFFQAIGHLKRTAGLS